MLTVSQTAALLRTFDNILILTHVRPDGDTVAAPQPVRRTAVSGQDGVSAAQSGADRHHRPLFPPLRGAGVLHAGQGGVHGHRHGGPVPGERQTIRGTGGSGH